MADARRCRVLWLVKGLGPGGAERLLVAAAAARDQDRFDYEVAYLLAWKAHLVPELEALGVAVTCLDARRDVDLRWAVRLRRHLLTHPVDVVHAHSPYVAAIARLVVRTIPRSRRPAFVTTEHNAWSTFALPTRVLNAATAPLDDATFAVSDEARASMWAPLRGRTTTLEHGIDLAAVRRAGDDRAAVRTELGIGDEEIVACTVANYREQKDYPTLLRAHRLLADRGVPVRGCAVGQGPLAEEIDALRRDLALEDRVLLTGYRPDATRVMGAADLFVLASRYEGLPVALMEALALGLPVVATAVGGVREVLAGSGAAVLVPPGDPAALAEAIEAVVTDPARRAAMRAESCALGARFDVRRAVTAIEARYLEVRAR